MRIMPPLRVIIEHPLREENGVVPENARAIRVPSGDHYDVTDV